MKMRVGQGFLSASDATDTDITWSGLGIPDACLIFATGSEALNASENNMQACIGYTDFTTDISIAFASDDAVGAPEGIHGIHSEAFAITRYDASSYNRTVSVTAITDGVRCTTLEAGNPYGYMVVAFFGGEWKCFQVIDDSTAFAGTIDIAHTLSGEPNLGFIGFSEISTIDVASSSSRWSFGMFTNKSETIVQNVFTHFATGNPLFSNAQLNDDKVAGGIDAGGAFDQSLKITAIDGTNITFTVEDSALTNDSFCGLVGLIDEDVDLVIANSPDSDSSDWNVNDSSFLPQGVIGMMTEMDVINQGETNNTSGMMGLWAFDNTGNEHSACWMLDDGSGSSGSPTTTRTKDRIADDFVLITDDETLNYHWNSPTLTSDGFDVVAANIDAVDVVTHLWPMMFIGEDSPVNITDVNTTESWTDGDTGLVITGTGFV